MDCIAVLQRYFSPEWMRALNALSATQRAEIQEIRLRAEAPVMLSTPIGERFLCVASCSALQQSDVLICYQDQLEACFLRLCEESVYAHETELQQGFLTVAGGIRVGVAGTAVCEAGKVKVVRQITSLCVRLPRLHRGCAASLLPLLCSSDGVQSTLLVGEPSSGKTSLLRDMAASLAARGLRVTVVDERGELAGIDGLRACDVLRGYPKSIGIWQAVRCLAPQVVLFDELGDDKEIEAVAACAHAGVAVIASLHGSSPQALQHKSCVRRLIMQEVFTQWVFLQGRYAPSQWRECLLPEVVGDEVVWRSAYCNSRSGTGLAVGASLVSTR